MRKRLFSLFLTLAFSVMCVLPTFASSYNAQVSTAKDLKTALSNPADRIEITLMNGFTVTAADGDGISNEHKDLNGDNAIDGVEKQKSALALFTIDGAQNKEVIINLNGKELSVKETASTGYALFKVQGGASLTINGEGAINATNRGIIVVGDMEQASEVSSTLNLNTGAEINSTKECAVFVTGKGATANISGTVTSEEYFAMATRGNDWDAGTTININEGASVSTTDPEAAAIYNPAIDSKVNVTGGEIEGATGIEMRAGELTVTGGDITGTGTPNIEENDSGTTTLGSGIAISQHLTDKAIKLNISGGEITGNPALSAVNPEGNTDDPGEQDDINLTITGGLFVQGDDPSEDVVYIQGAINSLNIAGGAFSGKLSTAADDDADEARAGNRGTITITGGMFNVDPTTFDEGVTIATDIPVKARLDSEDGNLYAFGESSVKELLNDAEEGDTLTVTEGTLTLTEAELNDVAPGVKISAEEGATANINGTTVNPGDEYTVPAPSTDDPTPDDTTPGVPDSDTPDSGTTGGTGSTDSSTGSTDSSTDSTDSSTGSTTSSSGKSASSPYSSSYKQATGDTDITLLWIALAVAGVMMVVLGLEKKKKSNIE